MGDTMNEYEISSLRQLLIETPSGTVIGSALAELAKINANLVLQLLKDSDGWRGKLVPTDWAPLMQFESTEGVSTEIRMTAIRLQTPNTLRR